MGILAQEWVEAYAAALGVPAPTSEETRALLALAGVAAHAAQRSAAPISCYLAARAGVTPEAALATAEELAAHGHDPATTRPGAE